MSANTPKKLKKRISDAVFVKRYFECGENQAELARKLKLTRQTVGDRLKRIGKKTIEQARQAGKVSVISSKEKAVKKSAFKAGETACLREWDYVQTLQDLLTDQREMAEQVKAEINEWMAVPGRKLKPYQLQMLLMTQQSIVKTCAAQHIVRKDIYHIKGFDQFYEGFARVFEKFEPDAQQKMYLELDEMWSMKRDLIKRRGK